MKRKHKSGYKDYFKKTAVYLAILLVITIVAVFVTINPVTNIVHKIEDQLYMGARDLECNDSVYDNPAVESADKLSVNYGDKIAVISSDDIALNCSVYYGANRKTMSNGAGFNTKSDLFGKGTSFVYSYLEGSFSSLDDCKKGNVLTLATNYGEMSYRVTEIRYIPDDKATFDKTDGNRLVLCAMTSDFSNHSGESLFVFAEMI